MSTKKKAGKTAAKPAKPQPKPRDTYALHLSAEEHQRVIKIQQSMPIPPSIARVLHEVIDRGCSALEKK